MVPILDGQRFGRLTFTGEVVPVVTPSRSRPSGQKRRGYVCRCECGNTTVQIAKDLRRGHAQSCGCSRRDTLRRLNASRRNANPDHNRLRQTWTGMIARCEDPSHEVYARYGGRGIVVVDAWRTDFEPFEQWALANGYRRGLSIDRIDNNGPYSPDNCRWTTHLVQNRNRRDNIALTAFGETKCLSEWIEDARCVVKRSSVRHRLDRGWSPERALSEPFIHQKDRNLKGFTSESARKLAASRERASTGRFQAS